MLTAKVLYDSVVSQFAPQDIDVMKLPAGVTVKFVTEHHDSPMTLYTVDHRNRIAFPVLASQMFLFDAPMDQFESVMGDHYIGRPRSTGEPPLPSMGHSSSAADAFDEPSALSCSSSHHNGQQSDEGNDHSPPQHSSYQSSRHSSVPHKRERDEADDDADAGHSTRGSSRRAVRGDSHHSVKSGDGRSERGDSPHPTARRDHCDDRQERLSHHHHHHNDQRQRSDNYHVRQQVPRHDEALHRGDRKEYRDKERLERRRPLTEAERAKQNQQIFDDVGF
ncbi:Hypothetical protein, putative [Bodo saltans]|uniref:Uncharacterized protein n=1 Tax=Bodo saltans TaxID=75058 RepID=A0A0S4JAW0_BODSA|nr:Hypothetical protein, putative [Bodo saltans]|eukprot:CUG88522.1 Hypothetical protein, putative [Bodo saltans]